MELEIVILGSGNVATHLSGALVKAGNKINQVYSRNIEMAKELAKKYGAIAINDISLIENEADLYIIAITDKEIGNLVSKIDFVKKKVVHTAGSVPLSVFPKNIEMKYDKNFNITACISLIYKVCVPIITITFEVNYLRIAT